MIVGADVWWLLGIPKQNGQHVIPFECWILWHAQFLLAKGPPA